MFYSTVIIINRSQRRVRQTCESQVVPFMLFIDEYRQLLTQFIEKSGFIITVNVNISLISKLCCNLWSIEEIGIKNMLKLTISLMH